MKLVRRACIVLLSGLIVPLVVVYGLRARHTSTPRILVAKDTSDIPTLSGSQGLSSYDPYFNRVNFTRDIMLPPTNLVSAPIQGIEAAERINEQMMRHHRDGRRKVHDVSTGELIDQGR